MCPNAEVREKIFPANAHPPKEVKVCTTVKRNEKDEARSMNYDGSEGTAAFLQDDALSITGLLAQQFISLRESSQNA